MKAVWYTRQGDAAEVLQFGELPTPVPGPGEVRVRLRASAVNPADANRRAGRRHPMSFPLVIPNSDGAGTIDAVGAGVDARRVGERVWLCFGQRGRPFGTAAEAICVAQDLASPLPDEIDEVEGACLGIPCMTAWWALFGAAPGACSSVLVTGGAGAVGHYAVQLAKWSGAFVIATARSPAKADHARRGGADLVVDPARDDAAQAILNATGGRGVDRIVDVDPVGNAALVMRCAAPGAVWATYAVGAESTLALAMPGLILGNITLQGVYLSGLQPAQRRDIQRGVQRWLAECPGAIHTVDRCFALRDTALAHLAVESGTKLGTVVVLCDTDSAPDDARQPAIERGGVQ